MANKKTKRYLKKNADKGEINDSVDYLRILARIIANKLLSDEEKDDRPQ